ncbi:hypothetical protein [Lichenibacterium dinghuense]|uniref:hypothetical protein n=1 Tax=Lichenibacterium dinghuense TaxID=2895977 RepID=UPI001F4419AB|nr:hypothetical protein [Lichenibacterium sp. 6Y81]
MTPEERLDAKVANEKAEILATLVNGVAGGTVLGGIITPIVVTKQLDLWWGGVSIGGAVLLHLIARLILHDLQLEE